MNYIFPSSRKLIFLISCTLLPLLATAQTSPEKLNEDSIRAEIMRLRVDLEDTRTNLRISHKKFRTGILVSGIGYSVVIIGGVLLGSQNYSEWGQPLVAVGGAMGFTGALLLLNSNRYIGRAGGAPLGDLPSDKAPLVLPDNAP